MQISIEDVDNVKNSSDTISEKQSRDLNAQAEETLMTFGTSVCIAVKLKSL
jgi:hypothetical protein